MRITCIERVGQWTRHPSQHETGTASSLRKSRIPELLQNGVEAVASTYPRHIECVQAERATRGVSMPIFGMALPIVPCPPKFSVRLSDVGDREIYRIDSLVSFLCYHERIWSGDASVQVSVRFSIQTYLMDQNLCETSAITTVSDAVTQT